MKTILIASDHNGVKNKELLKEHLQKKRYSVIDLGPYDDSLNVDYNLYAAQLAKIISNDEVQLGILICGTGVGMSIVANRFDGVRAVLAHNELSAINSRKHNNANVLCLGTWLSTPTDMKNLTALWLNEKWEYGRHVKRVECIDLKKGLILTYGMFDIIHKGHIELLRFAKSQGEKLIVAIDSDKRIKSILRSKKTLDTLTWWGKDKPINNQDDRKRVLENIKDVDEVILFNSHANLLNIFKTLKPRSIVKGSNWSNEQIRERDKVPANITIKVFPIVKKT